MSNQTEMATRIMPSQRIRTLEIELSLANREIVRMRETIAKFKMLLEKNDLVDEFIKTLEAA